jgi:hypothetical protein
MAVDGASLCRAGLDGGVVDGHFGLKNQLPGINRGIGLDNSSVLYTLV